MKSVYKLSLVAVLLAGGLVSCNKSDSNDPAPTPTPTPTPTTGGNGATDNSRYFKNFTDKDITVTMRQLEYKGKVGNTGTLDYDNEVYIAYDVKRNVPQPFAKHRILNWSVKGADGTVYRTDRELYYSDLDSVGDTRSNSGITVSRAQAMDLSTLDCVITLEP